jgi:hypothetical protein
MLSHRTVPSPGWLGMLALPVFIATFALQWWAYKIDRRPSDPT